MLNYLKKSKGILGMNARNLDFIRPYNKRRARRIADNKLISKRILRKNGIEVSSLIAKIKNFEDLDCFDWNSLPNSFVLKPCRGLGGEGILVIYGRKKNGNWVKATGQEVTERDLRNHVVNILEGSYSLAGVVDTAFFEERVKIAKIFKPYSFKGIPDIRIIVFNNVPVMAMLRLPTEQSQGRSNLHLGGICVGIDLARGVTTTAITKKLSTQQEHLIEHVPGTRLVLSGITIPFWQEMLAMSVKAQQITGLGFLGIDLMIDRERGPVVAELNSKPGLGIQIANLAPLKDRLEKVEGLKIKTVKKGVRVGQDLFGGEVEEDVETLTGKKTLGVFEATEITNPLNLASAKMVAKMDTGAYRTSIDRTVALKLGYGEIVEAFDKENLRILESFAQRQSHLSELKRKYLSRFPSLQNIRVTASSHGVTVRPIVTAGLNIAGVHFETGINIADREGLRCEAIIGRRDLKHFMVDPSKVKGLKLSA